MYTFQRMTKPQVYAKKKKKKKKKKLIRAIITVNMVNNATVFKIQHVQFALSFILSYAEII